MDSKTIQEQLTAFLKSATGNDSLTPQTDLLESGVIESLLMMDLVIFIETTYRISLDINDIRPETFRSICSMADIIGRRSTQSIETRAA